LLAYGILVEPNRLVVHQLNIDASKINIALKGQTAVALSDLHIDSIGRLENDILEFVKTRRPGFVFLTGDYIAWKGRYPLTLI